MSPACWGLEGSGESAAAGCLPAGEEAWKEAWRRAWKEAWRRPGGGPGARARGAALLEVRRQGPKLSSAALCGMKMHSSATILRGGQGGLTGPELRSQTSLG